MAHIDPEWFDTWNTTAGMLPAPCKLNASLLVKRAGGGSFVTQVTLAGWNEGAQPVVILPNGKLGALTQGMEISDVGPS